MPFGSKFRILSSKVWDIIFIISQEKFWNFHSKLIYEKCLEIKIKQIINVNKIPICQEHGKATDCNRSHKALPNEETMLRQLGPMISTRTARNCKNIESSQKGQHDHCCWFIENLYQFEIVYCHTISRSATSCTDILNF